MPGIVCGQLHYWKCCWIILTKIKTNKYSNRWVIFSLNFNVTCSVAPWTKWAFGSNQHATKNILYSRLCVSTSVLLHIKQHNKITSKFQTPSDCTFHCPWTGWPQSGIESKYLESIFTNNIWIRAHLFIKCQEVAAYIMAFTIASKHRFSGRIEILSRKGGNRRTASEVWLKKARRQ